MLADRSPCTAAGKRGGIWPGTAGPASPSGLDKRSCLPCTVYASLGLNPARRRGVSRAPTEAALGILVALLPLPTCTPSSSLRRTTASVPTRGGQQRARAGYSETPYAGACQRDRGQLTRAGSRSPLPGRTSAGRFIEAARPLDACDHNSASAELAPSFALAPFSSVGFKARLSWGV